MEKKIYLVWAIMACFVMNASAQFSNSGGNSTTVSDNFGWNTVYVEWNPSNANIPKNNDFFWDNDVDGKYNGFSLGYSRTISLTQSLPIFLEVGLAGQFSHKTWENDDNHHKLSAISIKVPINVLYKFDIPNRPVSLIPFAGLTVRGNVWVQYKENDGNYNVFDKEDMEEKEGNTGKRVQIGWQIGLKARFAEKYIIGSSYGSDFNEIFNDLKARTGTVMVGYIF